MRFYGCINWDLKLEFQIIWRIAHISFVVFSGIPQL